MRSVGIDLQRWIDKGLLSIQARRPTLFGIEEHLMAIYREARRLGPEAVVIDPITNFRSIGSPWEVKSLVTRVLDQLRGMGATVLLTSLMPGRGSADNSKAGVSSMMDTWIALNQKMDGNVRQCYLYVMKSRGMDHSREVRELNMSASGLSLRPISAAGSEDNQRREPSGSSGGE
jgi:circadian clock protein KaiC